LRQIERGQFPSHDITIYSRDEERQAQLRRRYPFVRCVLGDVRDREHLATAMAGHDLVVHMAALKFIPEAELNVAECIGVNIGGAESVIYAARKAGVARVVGISTDKACLDYFAPVRLADGSTRKIADLVRERYDGEVITLGPNGLTTKRVVGWHRNPLGERRMIGLTYERAHQHAGQRQRVWLTEDHRVLTPDGWIEAGQIKSGDPIVTEEPSLTHRQYELAMGTLLGDSSLVSTGESGRAGFTTFHGAKDGEWQAILERELPTAASAQWGELYDAWYPEGKKAVPRRHVLAAWSDRMLAAWYMDDGCVSRTNGGTTLHARLATHGLTFEDAEWLAERLTKDGLDSHVLSVRSGKYGPYPEIRLSSDATRALFGRIGRFVMGRMRRKLSDDCPQYDSSSWRCGGDAAEPYVGRAVIDSRERYPRLGKGLRNRKRGQRSVYCLDVEDTHNFAASGVIVHNCQPVNVYGASKMALERLFAAASDAATAFTCTRYGNVIGSTGSVIPLFQRQAREQGRVTLTNRTMTRFWMTVDEACDVIQLALAATPGSVVIPQVRAMAMEDLALAATPEGTEFEEIGLRPGEKMHESLLHHQESTRVARHRDHLELLPTGQAPPNSVESFEIRSNNPDHWIRVEEMRSYIAAAQEV